MKMTGKMAARDVRENWRDAVDYVVGGNHMVISRSGKPVVALIPFEDFVALKGELEDLHDVRSAQKSLADGALDGDPVALRVLARDAGFRLVPGTGEPEQVVTEAKEAIVA